MSGVKIMIEFDIWVDELIGRNVLSGVISKYQKPDFLASDIIRMDLIAQKERFYDKLSYSTHLTALEHYHSFIGINQEIVELASTLHSRYGEGVEVKREYIIAATCILHGIILVTRKDMYSRIKELKVELINQK